MVRPYTKLITQLSQILVEDISFYAATNFKVSMVIQKVFLFYFLYFFNNSFFTSGAIHMQQ